MVTHGRKGIRLFLALALLTSIWAVAGVSSAEAAFSFTPGSFSIAQLNGASEPATQAGGHPNLVTKFFVKTKTTSSGAVVADETMKDINVTLPPGIIGNAASVPACTQAELAAEGTPFYPAACPQGSMVGVMTLYFAGCPELESCPYPLPLYNVAPGADAPAALGFSLGIGAEITMPAKVTADGYSVRIASDNTAGALALVGAGIEVWGVPQEHNSSGEAPSGFMRSTTSCEAGMTARIDGTSWQEPEAPPAVETFPMETATGCDELPFEPSVTATPNNTEAGAPSGYSVDVELPQTEDPEKPSTADLRKAVVKLPQGVSLSPTVAGGLEACSDEQFGLGEEGEPSCPLASKVGTLSIDTPLLEAPMSGDVYVGKQLSNDPQSGEMFRIFLLAAGSGVRIKLKGEMSVDPVTGQLTTTFDENPQLPFSKLHLQFKDGPRAPLVNPPGCGTYTTHGTFTSWAQPGSPVATESSFAIDKGCGRDSQFTPGLEAGTEDPDAGASSPFILRVSGQEGQQNLSRIDATLPEGLLAKLGGVPLCGDAEAASGACPAGSQIGEAVVGVGEGSSPIYVPQPGKPTPSVYLAGPYNGAPYSLVVEVAAQAGPFNLGNVVVRSALGVNPETTQVSVSSDPLPQVVGGVPVAYRDIRVRVNRPDFTVNPTSCEEMSVGSTLVSSGGQTASPSSRFQVGGCRELGFKPSLNLSLVGGTHRGSHPKLRAVVKMPAGDANIGRAVVTLPHAAFLDQAHIRTVCTRVQFAADACPKGSVYGRTKAYSPLLGYALSGPVYLRSSSHELPDLVARLRGPGEQPIEIDLDGRIDSVHGALRTTFAQVPDAPVSRVVLEMFGGKRGLIELSTDDYCAGKHRVKAAFTGQNGSRSSSRPVLGNARCTK